MSYSGGNLHIIARPKLFRQRIVVALLGEIANFAREQGLGMSWNGPGYESLKPVRWMVKIFFTEDGDREKFESLLVSARYLEDLARYCKGGDTGVVLRRLGGEPKLSTLRELLG